MPCFKTEMEGDTSDTSEDFWVKEGEDVAWMTLIFFCFGVMLFEKAFSKDKDLIELPFLSSSCSALSDVRLKIHFEMESLSVTRSS